MRVGPHLSVQVIVAAVVAGAMLVLIVPLPGWLLDLLVAAHLAVSLAVFALALLVGRPARLSGLPGLMVVSSLTRVVLALAVARNILLGGGGGEVVSALGGMSAGSGWLTGIVVVLMVALIDLLVIAVGLVRVSEVLARFALDALPGRQMAIDAAVADGRISAEEASARAQEVDAECGFYGAMDGAARFLRGDCIATIIIVAATPIVAVLIGGSGAATAAGGLSSYLQMTTGHGLVILLPALLVGGAGAIVLARSGSDRVFGAEIAEQLLVQPVALAATAIVLFVVALLAPGGRLPLIVVAVAIAAVVVIVGRRAARESPAEPQAHQPRGNRVEIGLGLVQLIQEADFGAMLSQMRQRVQRTVGFEIAPFVVADNGELGMQQMAVVADGQRIALCTIRASRLLAVGYCAPDVAEAERAECGPHILGTWIRSDDEVAVRSQGTEVLTPSEALLLAVQDRLVACADRIFDTQYAADMLETLAQTHPAVVAAAQAEGIDAIALANIGSALLAEGIGLQDTARIVQAAVASLREGVGQRDLAESVRGQLPEHICRVAAPDGEILSIEMEPGVEQQLLACYDKGQLAIPPQLAQRWLGLLAEYGREAVGRNHPIAILCGSEARPAVSKLLCGSGQKLLAIAYDELQPGYSVQRLATITEVELSEHQAPSHDGEE